MKKAVDKEVLRREDLCLRQVDKNFSRKRAYREGEYICRVVLASVREVESAGERISRED